MLRGAGVALALPWLESLARPARAQAVPRRKRFVAFFIPNGAPDLWTPPRSGAGDAWELSSVLEPLAPLKSKVTVISGLENGSAFNSDGSSLVEPSHGRQAAAWLTCVDSRELETSLGVRGANGISVDQVMAAHPVFAGQTPLPSVQVGISSLQSWCDSTHCAYSRSVSWRTQTEPMYKVVDPRAFFEQLVGAAPGSLPFTRREARLSVLDSVRESASALRPRLSSADGQTLDQFLTSVRSVEQRVSDGACAVSAVRPSFIEVTGEGRRKNDDSGYDKRVHFDLMNELLATAFQCDQSRIASFMLEDERSEFVYDFLPQRAFNALTSVPSTGTCPEWHAGGQSGSVDAFASIVHWHIGKIAELCQCLAAIDDGNGQTALDNTVVFVGSGMHGSNHQAADLPALVIGGGGGSLKTDQHLALGKRPLRDLHYTLMNGVFGLGVTDFGENRTGAPIASIDALLNV